ncbi:pterin 4 alpha carbinolamine dehydratase-domain-containing protein [Nemania sp. FL0031]|nr:pterin 4 alpha carbinolamine dehydratase-domain-containing protein [Nemania sp. FL0031]
MFACHTGLALRHTKASMSRGKVTQILHLTLTRQATREIRPPTQLYRFQSSSSSTVGGAMTNNMVNDNNNNNNTKVKFSAGTDESALTAALQELLDSAGRGGRWALISTGKGLERSFKFKNFTKTWDFMTAVALQCKLKNHHPEWSNVYNTTYIRWTTHSPAGLSAKDVELAGLCDALARDVGEVVDAGDAAQSSGLKQVADRVVVDAGDCCVPKKL